MTSIRNEHYYQRNHLDICATQKKQYATYLAVKKKNYADRLRYKLKLKYKTEDT